ncbi:MAG TPA: MFS transporter [Burkholderiales bacterium]|jgi:putative MFS transporter|nr:MFS transporter [Burkholderiales bacterium]
MPAAPALTEQSIAARLERLPVSPWHIKMRVVFGVATFFDAFDALTVAFVLPAIIGPWKIAPGDIGNLIAIGFAGQAIGALFFGWLAERIGRVLAARITIAIFAAMSFVCATAGSYDELFWYRFIQGLGLGGQVPIAAAYITEIARSSHRGRFVLLYELVFPIGLLCAGFAGAWIVPRFGWQWLFVLGGVPAVMVVFLQRIVPESPRWLASRGRLAEADHLLTGIEDAVSSGGARQLPPVPELAAPKAKARMRWVELFEGEYRTRTLVVWVLWATSFLVGNGLVVWLPSLYRTVYKLPLQESLNYGLLANFAGLLGSLTFALTIDWTGRKRAFSLAFVVSSVALFVLWALGTTGLTTFIALACFVTFWVFGINLALYLYTAEIYPTRMRALGTSWATFWLRFASIIGPYVVGWILPKYGVAGMFFFYGLVAALGGLACLIGITETKGKVLEEVSP